MHRVCANFAGMGLIASPAFADAIVAFKESPPTYSKDNRTPPCTYMGGYNVQYYDYALHRCGRKQNWQLEKGEDGEYFIKKP
jgi:hypothetical protein